MKLILSLIVVVLCVTIHAATTFTEFYCNYTTGANTNAGSSTGAAAYSSINGNWDGTSVFIPTDSSNPSGTVNVGDWASIYLDAAAVSAYVARVTAVTNAVNGGIVLDTAAKAGTAPGSGATGNSITVGGVWKGPNANDLFPFNFASNTLTNSSGNVPRVNYQNGATYAVTAAATHSLAGPIIFQGYSSSPGDFGKATIDCATAGASIVMLTVSGANCDLSDFIISNSGATSGSSDGLVITGAECNGTRIVAHDVRRAGITCGGTASSLVECETYLCNKGNTASLGGINATGTGVLLLRCISHDNATANASGFVTGGTASTTAISCISDSNGANGFLFNGTGSLFLMGCDVYNNGAAGLDMTTASATSIKIQNCNFIKNTTYGITSSGSSIRNGSIVNCGFGSGTSTNSSGSMASNLGGLNVYGTITYAADVTPWSAPATGDFRVNLAAAKGAGRGVFTETQVSYTGTVSYPDIGAAQHADSGSGQRSYVY